MIEAIEFLWPPFLVAVCLVGIHVYFGIQVLARNVIFVDLALAQIAALGATVAFMLGHPAQSLATYGYSLGFTLGAALLLAFTRHWAKRVPQEALIGVIYVVAAAASILLIDRAPQGAEHLKQILTGNILTSGLGEVAIIVPLYVGVGLVHFLLPSRLMHAGSLFWEFVFYSTFGLVVTSSVALAGVLLVFSFLIIPAIIGVMFASSPSKQLAIGWAAGTLTSAVGLAASFVLDLPTGAAIVCTFGAALALAGAAYPFFRGGRLVTLGIAVRVARWGCAAVIAGSALQLAFAPRGDQPLMDMLETVAPSLRSLYFTEVEAATYRESNEYAERHRLAAEQLIELERRRRTQGEALDDIEVRRISSFMKSYVEMRKGEHFVMAEVRARARERIRWPASLSLVALALLIAPLPWRRLGARLPHRFQPVLRASQRSTVDR
ncbi:MAG: metal ABC transporter permease [Bradyrhizobium sp.]|jgi:zinc/manganese transport system permease protein